MYNISNEKLQDNFEKLKIVMNKFNAISEKHNTDNLADFMTPMDVKEIKYYIDNMLEILNIKED
jgi:hypothetical protein